MAAPCYHYNFVLEDGPGSDMGFTTVAFHTWGLYLDSQGNPHGVVELGKSECEIYIGEVTTDDHDGPVVMIGTYLKELDIPISCHPRMIAWLMRYLETHVIFNSSSSHRRVTMRIVQAMIIVADDVLEEALGTESSTILENMSGETTEWRQWKKMNLGVSSWWLCLMPDEAEGDLGRAVRFLRQLYVDHALAIVTPPPRRLPNKGSFAMRGRMERGRGGVLPNYSYSRVEEGAARPRPRRGLMGRGRSRGGVLQNYSDRRVEEGAARPGSASEAAIARLEKVDHQQGGEEVALSCVICMNEEGEREFSRTPCKHAFHTNCVRTWLRASSYCPLCRRAVS